MWCGQRDSNPHARATDFKAVVYTYFTMSAHILLILFITDSLIIYIYFELHLVRATGIEPARLAAHIILVGVVGLEPTMSKTLEPKSSGYTILLHPQHSLSFNR